MMGGTLSDYEMSERPFYSSFAWAYDPLITGPIDSRCSFVQRVANLFGILPNSPLLDAGCGTGNYAIELAKRGYIVTGIDASMAFIALARAKAEEVKAPVTFKVGNILKLPSGPNYGLVLCRGVLNDFIDEPSRQQALISLVHSLQNGGALILDVREWTVSALRLEKAPVFEKEIEIDRGTLAFRSITRLEHKTRRLLIKENYALRRKDGTETSAEYDFVMQCWNKDELHQGLISAGVATVDYLGAYDPDCPIGSTDRIVAVASL